jgi:hypothetical protein
VNGYPLVQYGGTPTSPEPGFDGAPTGGPGPHPLPGDAAARRQPAADNQQVSNRVVFLLAPVLVPGSVLGSGNLDLAGALAESLINGYPLIQYGGTPTLPEPGFNGVPLGDQGLPSQPSDAVVKEQGPPAVNDYSSRLVPLFLVPALIAPGGLLGSGTGDVAGAVIEVWSTAIPLFNMAEHQPCQSPASTAYRSEIRAYLHRPAMPPRLRPP